MELRRTTALWSPALVGACATAGSAMSLPPQATVVDELPFHYVPLAATGQTACPIASSPPQLVSKIS